MSSDSEQHGFGFLGLTLGPNCGNGWLYHRDSCHPPQTDKISLYIHCAQAPDRLHLNNSFCMSIIQAIVFAIIEGITEFFPISSTGHMIIGSSLMGIASDPFTKMFTVAIQFGAILSVIVLYWKRFLPKQRFFAGDLTFYLKLFVAFLPALLSGYLLNRLIDAVAGACGCCGICSYCGGIFFLFVDKIFQKNETYPDQTVSYPSALKIGFFQTIAMIPGVSRSAATIIGGLTQKLNKKTAAEFSFFLAVPTMFAATAL